MKLSDIGVSHKMSERVQMIASVPEDEFEQTIAEHREQQKELTSSTRLKLIRVLESDLDIGHRIPKPAQLSGKDCQLAGAQ